MRKNDLFCVTLRGPGPAGLAGFALAALLLAAAPNALAAPGWFIPMGEQVPGGFDFLQIKITGPNAFDTPAMAVFFGSAAGSEDWDQTYFDGIGAVATAAGTSPGDEPIYFVICLLGDRNVDRPIVHFQAYLNSERVDNADLISTGPGDYDWDVQPGTWAQDAPIEGIPGDTNNDGVVDAADYVALKRSMGQSFVAIKALGDFDFDGDRDWYDLQILTCAFGAGIGSAPSTAPEPASLGLLALGALAVIRRRRPKQDGQVRRRTKRHLETDSGCGPAMNEPPGGTGREV
jgi:MYXO-CTERM domain-containing protein